jgi:hypothetical protein
MKDTAPTAERLVAARARKLQLANDALAYLYLDRAKVIASMAEVAAGAESALRKRLVTKWSREIATMDVGDGRGLGRRIHDELGADMRALGDHFHD